MIFCTLKTRSTSFVLLSTASVYEGEVLAIFQSFLYSYMISNIENIFDRINFISAFFNNSCLVVSVDSTLCYYDPP